MHSIFANQRYLAYARKWHASFVASNTPLTHAEYGFPITIDPAVYPSHPQITYSSSLIIEQLPHSLLGREVLDVGTGCGVIAIAAALRGANVVACDNEPTAIDLARLNVAGNDVAERITIVESNLLEALHSPANYQRFDLVTANLWFPIKSWGFRHEHKELMAIQRQFLSTVPFFLKPNGLAYLASAAFADLDGIFELFAEMNIVPRVYRRKALHGPVKIKVEWLLFVFGPGHASCLG